MRMESKHRYSKNAQRHSVNFINPTKSCTEKHQLLQCLYTGDTSRFSIDIISPDSKCIDVNIFSKDELILLTKTINLCNYLYASKIEYFGTQYNNQKMLFLGVDIYCNYVLGFIRHIFHDDQYKKLFFMGTIASGKNINGNVVIESGETTNYFIRSFEQLLDKFPLNIYNFNNTKYFIQKQAFPFV